MIFGEKVSPQHLPVLIPAMVLGAALGTTLAKRIVDTFMKTNFEGGRHERRIRKIIEIEEGRAPSK